MSTNGHATAALFIEALRAQVMPLLSLAGMENVAGIGVGAPLANQGTGSIENAANLPWQGIIPIARLLQEAFQLPVAITNDANAAALGEMMYGIAQGIKDFILITLGTGIGGGIVSGGHLLYGHDGLAGEIGHVIAVRGGRLCGCGRRGCLETYASATGMVHTAQEWLEKENTPSLLRNMPPPLTALSIARAAGQGDAVALRIFEDTARILGEAMANVVALLSPQAIVFFGGLAHAGNLLLEPAHRYMEQNLLHVHKHQVAFLRSVLPDADAAILGASALVWQ
jgi:glucokinase